ncbi:hypothetical protein D3C80_1378580 [compost metagenome]
MAQFSSQAGEALIDFAIDNNSAANASAQCKADTIINTFTCTTPRFTKRSHVSVIVYFDRLAEAIFQYFTNRKVFQAYIRC